MANFEDWSKKQNDQRDNSSEEKKATHGNEKNEDTEIPTFRRDFEDD